MWFCKHSYEVSTAGWHIKEIFNIFIICLLSGDFDRQFDVGVDAVGF
jgi:hypothetical protein